jgi:hypothetical protein
MGDNSDNIGQAVLMLSVKVSKDINSYQPKIALGLSKRMLLSIGGALGTAVLLGVYTTFVLGVGTDALSVLVPLVSLPFWLCGFVRFKDMPFERYFPLYMAFWARGGRLLYKSPVPGRRRHGSRRPQRRTDRGREAVL